VHERYRDTNVFWVRGKMLEPIFNCLYMFQNFHLIHHLFPRVPFYFYPKAFRSLKPVLDRERAHIYEFGHEGKAESRHPGASQDPVHSS
jgi:beta-carotene hydroxylase